MVTYFLGPLPSVKNGPVDSWCARDSGAVRYDSRSVANRVFMDRKTYISTVHSIYHIQSFVV